MCLNNNIKQSLCVQAEESICTAQVLLRAQCGIMAGMYALEIIVWSLKSEEAN